MCIRRGTKKITSWLRSHMNLAVDSEARPNVFPQSRGIHSQILWGSNIPKPTWNYSITEFERHGSSICIHFIEARTHISTVKNGAGTSVARLTPGPRMCRDSYKHSESLYTIFPEERDEISKHSGWNSCCSPSRYFQISRTSLFLTMCTLFLSRSSSLTA
jgi:hypothetical protein